MAGPPENPDIYNSLTTEQPETGYSVSTLGMMQNIGSVGKVKNTLSCKGRGLANVHEGNKNRTLTSIMRVMPF
jgi:hypothetical protein